MLRALKEKYGKWQLNKIDQKRRHKAVSINWDKVKKLGILYDGKNKEAFLTVKKFSESLKDKSVSTLGYVDEKELSDFHIQSEPYRFFCKSDLNWYYMPVSDIADGFTQESFDLLINLSPDDVLPMEFIVSKSHSRFIAGKYTDNKKNDLMIDTKGNNSNEYLLEQIVRYLKMIKPE